MKITIITTIILSAFLLTACGEGHANDTTSDALPPDSVETETLPVTETIEPSALENTVTDEQMAHYEELLDLTSTETTLSDCYITESFVYNDATYITVDFVNYRIIEGTEEGEEEVELVNVIKTLRTFVVAQSYYDCAHTNMVDLSDLIEQNNATTNLVFRIEVEDGIVSELYLDNCSG